MYTGAKKETELETKQVPIGILVGLRNQGNGKGIKGLVVPKQVSFVISNSNVDKLNYLENTIGNYETNTEYDIIINNNRMPSIDNGTVIGSIDGHLLNVSITNIESKISQMSDIYYFTSKYFVTEIPRRGEFDYSDVNVSLSAIERVSSSGQASSTSIIDSYNYILGNYTSNIEVYERNPEGGSISQAALPYGNANINYGEDYTLEVNFSYNNRTDSQGDGLTSLTNYVKIDNNALKLFENTGTNKAYEFTDHSTDREYEIELDVDQNTHQKVYFGFGEWDSNYFDIAQNAPTGCPSSLDGLSKEQIMNLYGGPCIIEKNTIQWAYSPVASDDISGNAITTAKGPMIVKSTYISTKGDTCIWHIRVIWRCYR